MKYHILPFLTPKWVPYELQTKMGATPNFAAMERAWDNILKIYHTKWYKRWLYQPWFSWEYHATNKRVNIFFMTPNDYLGPMTWDTYANQMGDTFFQDNAPPAFDFNKPHAGVKMELERDFSVPILLSSEQDGSFDPYTYLINMLNGMQPDMHAVIQFLVRPIYDSQVASHFKKALKRVRKSKGLPGENDQYLSAITNKMYKNKAEVAIKLAVFGPSQEQVSKQLDVLVHAFGGFQSEEMNRLTDREWFRIIRPLFRFELENRIFPMRRISNANIMATDEMANLLRHPTSGGTSRFIKLKFQKVPIPHLIRRQGNTEKPKIHLGKSEHMAFDLDTYLPLELLNNHMTVLGGKESGKAEFLVDLVTKLAHLSDEENKMGFTVIDTVGNLAEEIIARIPKEKQDRIRAIRLNDGKFPMNLFEWDFDAPPQVKSRLLTFLMGGESPTLMDQFILIGTALDKLNLATLRNMQRFFEDPEFRERIAFFWRDIEEPDHVPVKRFLEKYSNLTTFQKEFINSPIYQLVKSFNTSGTTGPFRKKTNGLEFTRNMREGKFQILDISNLASDDSHTIGKHVLSFLHCALLARGQSALDAGETPNMHPIILHEASGFLGGSIFRSLETFMDEARIYRTPLILSIQGIASHLPKDIADAVFRRAASLVSFQLRNSSDAEFVAKSSNAGVTGITGQDLERIDPGYCYISIPAEKQASGLFTLKPNQLEDGLYQHIAESLYAESLRLATEKEKQAVEEMERQEAERMVIWEREKEAYRKEMAEKRAKEKSDSPDLEDYLQFTYGTTGENRYGQMGPK
ncbi:hypothetical protein [Risungbinella massiliensis]|uniref:hypothetical protein n=1 Tax=Risungbinella massiliensis TaxID=1329796 RepID=UPI0005CBD9E1|nr:hypothetical protein [Risungbinella massiliensis]